SEVVELFPGRYVHVGGDEAVKDQWRASESTQRRMQELGIANEIELQSYFVKRIERFLQSKGRRLIGWDEILDGGIAPQATVMSWRGLEGAVAAATQGHDTVLSPSPTVYFDHLQSTLATEPPGRGGVVSLEDVYRFDPVPPSLDAKQQEHVLGVQANVWSEHIRTPDRVTYMTFPRAAALAEVAWTAAEQIDWHDFVRRLGAQFDRYRALRMPFATSAFDLRATADGLVPGRPAAVRLSNQSGVGEIRYTTDGTAPTADSTLYTGPLELPLATNLAAVTFANGRQLSRVLQGTVGEIARRRYSQELEACSESIVLSLEDDAPIRGERSVFLIDIMNPCWIWPQADLSAVSGIKAAVGQVPFNFQIGADRDQIELPEPRTATGELEVRANGCDGRLLAVMPLEQAAESNEVTVLAQEFAEPQDARTDLCFRFTADKLDPMWAIDWIELTGPEEP
ncbi:MAG: beta-N-acetylhexosaminidase, partial [Planctomycetaceae bacterium]